MCLMHHGVYLFLAVVVESYCVRPISGHALFASCFLALTTLGWCCCGLDQQSPIAVRKIILA